MLQEQAQMPKSLLTEDNVALSNYPLFLIFEQIKIEASQSYVFDASVLSEN